MVFANLLNGRCALCSIERGLGDIEEAENIMGNLLYVGLPVWFLILGLLIKACTIYVGASDMMIKYANEYITIIF